MNDVTRYGWNEMDRARERDEARSADLRLEAWGIWARTSGVNTEASRAYIVTADDIDEAELFNREARVVIIDTECEEIDKILAAMAIHVGQVRYWKLANIEYRTYGTIETKARRARLSQHDYRYRLRQLQLLVHHELDSLRRKTYKRS